MQGADTSKRDCFREISATFAEAQCTAPGQMGYIWSCGGGGGGGGAATTGGSTAGGGRRRVDDGESGSGSGSGQGSGSGELGSGDAQGSGAVVEAGYSAACPAECASWVLTLTEQVLQAMVDGLSQCTGELLH